MGAEVLRYSSTLTNPSIVGQDTRRGEIEPATQPAATTASAASATGDEQWIHVNVERATRELPGHSTIAHGLLTLALAPGIVRSVMGVKGIKNTQNYWAKSYSLLDPSARGLKAARWG